MARASSCMIGSAAGVARDIGAALEHAEHAEDLADRAAEPQRQRFLREAARLLGQRLQQIEALFEGRRPRAFNRPVDRLFPLDSHSRSFHI
jgi:hypothetical protein